jgi:hypothetical protein
MDEREFVDGLVDGFAREVRVEDSGRECRVEFTGPGVCRISFSSHEPGQWHIRECQWASVNERQSVFDWVRYLRDEGFISAADCDEILNRFSTAIADHVYAGHQLNRVSAMAPMSRPRRDERFEVCSPVGTVYDSNNVGHLNERRVSDFVVDAIILVVLGSFIYTVVEWAQWGNW